MKSYIGKYFLTLVCNNYTAVEFLQTLPQKKRSSAFTVADRRVVHRQAQAGFEVVFAAGTHTVS
jgi:hypothetical protein